MKTIELPDYLADALIAIGHELATQDNLGTSWPVWVVMERKKRYVPYFSDWDEKERVDPDNTNGDELCEDCREAMKRGSLPEVCELDLCEPDAYHYFNWVDEPSFWKGPGIFLTQKACQEHIEDHSYDYGDVRPYAYSAYRNYELQPIIQALIIAAGQEVPSNHYGVVKEP